MRKLLVCLLFVTFIFPGFLFAGGKGSGRKSSSSSGKTVHVKGYYRKDGTYVAPYDRRSPGSGHDYTPPTYSPPAIDPVVNAPHKNPDPSPKEEKSWKQLTDIEKARWRTWTSADGKYTVEARFMQAMGETVHLEKRSGTVIRVKKDNLSDQDLKWIKNQGWKTP